MKCDHVCLTVICSVILKVIQSSCFCFHRIQQSDGSIEALLKRLLIKLMKQFLIFCLFVLFQFDRTHWPFHNRKSTCKFKLELSHRENSCKKPFKGCLLQILYHLLMARKAYKAHKGLLCVQVVKLKVFNTMFQSVDD